MVTFSLVILSDLSKLHGSIEAGALLAGEGVLGVVAGEGALVKHGALAANKAVLVHAVQLPVIVVHGVADVENLKRQGYFNENEDVVLKNVAAALTGCCLNSKGW